MREVERDVEVTGMVNRSQILAFSAQIAEKFRPERIILFGSYAYGTPTEDSDVDLLVVLPFEGKWHDKAVEILTTIRSGFPIDLVVATPSYLQNRIEMEDFFLREIVDRGTILHGAAYAGVG